MKVARRKLMALVLLGGFVSAKAANAHALPDSIIVFRESGNFSVEFEMPLRELQNASSIFSEKMNHAEFAEKLDAYVRQHFAVTSREGTHLSLKRVDFKISQRRGDHVGLYDVVIAKYTGSSLDDFDLNSATVKTDIILHQVVSHSVIVLWQDEMGKQREIGRIAYDFLKKSVQPLLIAKP